MSLTLTHIWAETLIDELSRLGVKHICIAPGSRSTPLTLAAVKQSQHPQRPVTLHCHFDERGLGYLALGLAKAGQAPVAVIVTSGTAVANCLPAVVESGLTGEPLIILSADRPFELVDCGANQAIVQRDLFSSHVTAQLDLPTPDAGMPLSALLTKVDQVLAHQAACGGSVHINCPFREPFYGERDAALEAEIRAPIANWYQSQQSYTRHHGRFSTPIERDSLPPSLPSDRPVKTVIVAGALPHGLSASVNRLATALNAVVLADPQSGITSTAPGYDLWLNHPNLQAQLSQAQWVIQLGGRLVSKRLGQWLAQTSAQYWLVTDNAQPLDPHHRAIEQCVVDKRHWSLWLDALTDQVSAACSTSEGFTSSVGSPLVWQQTLTNEARAQMEKATDRLSPSLLSEHRLFQQLPTMLPEHVDIFIGNSLAIRLADIWSQLGAYPVFANRGASGIDGLFACAAGVQRCRRQPMLVVLGDTSALYDLNSLALWRETAAPAAMLILNNNGGGIFDSLPVDPQLCDAYYRMPHGLHFEQVAAQFSLNYQQPTCESDLAAALVQAFNTPGTDVIEVVTPAGEAGKILTEQLANMAAQEG
ncbi:2-succinyl-5-enolpyruvyl-6-hydroxy-3-cyclohexene-1-carboxylic-acid synthase [Salinivibrio sp. EAGSL]|uniref:2-succinyl-5-enolpyruvyl-6-hydroxy-3- cyclohexene-1-carboxylic-acid synthase n=1 Tax=Salinivibrio sp. EAGSL TaxID=2738468 RepID=UPI00158AB70F|nr:2-succinyl-5-enolpyruvyl-6-hydroxy-3-cyclohexene-1-carboxylic-acid synthase [Salinivibrio sp. EAGSL]NUY56362.1 2-succinyl-5-enolpyruvyl-6-hydroxy-3-cyclohexene-1-carboxylic-acid synthase [Salinivibrio sp. EAGSL]